LEPPVRRESADEAGAAAVGRTEPVRDERLDLRPLEVQRLQDLELVEATAPALTAAGRGDGGAREPRRQAGDLGGDLAVGALRLLCVLAAEDLVEAVEQQHRAAVRESLDDVVAGVLEAVVLGPVFRQVVQQRGMLALHEPEQLDVRRE